MAHCNPIKSYGPCQFPTLGFVVERWKKIEEFVPEDFWYIYLKHEKTVANNQKESVEFLWDRKHLFDRLTAAILYEKCFEAAQATVISVTGTDKNRWRPLPLSTIEMQKLATKKLRISSDRLMDIAEKLYNKGFISYPRTETDVFTKTINVTGLVEIQKEHPVWGAYATMLLDENKFLWPRAGSHDDKAHPPIHPVKMLAQNTEGMNHDEFRVYELITRHFLACCSRDAKGFETVIRIEINREFFHAKGLMIKEMNWLEVYPYERWAASTLPNLKVNDRFTPSELLLKESRTSPPSLLTEAELIGLMDSNGIGTDATIHEHIKTIQERHYAEKHNNMFKPTKLGAALIRAYEEMDIDLWKPHLRAEMERNMTQIAQGTMRKETFLTVCLKEIEAIFKSMKEKSETLFTIMGGYFTRNNNNRGGGGEGDGGNGVGADGRLSGNNFNLEEFEAVGDDQGVCGKCGENGMTIKRNNDGQKIGVCEPCSLVLKIPRKDCAFFNHICPLCSFQILEFKNENNSKYTLCPWCFNNPPDFFLQLLDNNGNNNDNNFSKPSMPCFKCTNRECALAKGVNEERPVMKCYSCKQQHMTIKITKRNTYFLGCKGYPNCRTSIFLPEIISNATVSENSCQKCGVEVKKVKLAFSNDELIPSLLQFKIEECGSEFCLRGCERELESIGVKLPVLNLNNAGNPPNANASNNANFVVRQNNSNSNQRNLQIGYEESKGSHSNSVGMGLFNRPNVNSSNNRENSFPSMNRNGNSTDTNARNNVNVNLGNNKNNTRPNLFENAMNGPRNNSNNNPAPIDTTSRLNFNKTISSPLNVKQTSTVVNQPPTSLTAARPVNQPQFIKPGIFCTKCKKIGHSSDNCPILAVPRVSADQLPPTNISAPVNSNYSVPSKSSQQPNNGSSNNVTCYKCGKAGHIAPNCPGPASNKDSSPWNNTHENKDSSDQEGGKWNQRSFNNNNQNNFNRNENNSNNNNDTKKNVCYKCNQEGHWANKCPNPNAQSNNYNKSSNSDQVVCFKCQQPGHWANKCPNPNAPSNNYNKSSNSDQVICFKCQQPGHWASKCPNPPSNGNGGNSNNFGRSNNFGNGPRSNDNNSSKFQSGKTSSSNKDGHNAGEAFANSNLQNITCFKCQQKGHYATKCPSLGDSKPAGSNNFSFGKGGFKGKDGPKKRTYDELHNGDEGGGGKTNKQCTSCGTVGRHPKGSTCPSVRRNKKTKLTVNENDNYQGDSNNQGEFDNNGDFPAEEFS